jgi:hypothetical protein
MKHRKIQIGSKLVYSFKTGSLLEYNENDAKILNDGHHVILNGYPYGCRRHADERLFIGKDVKTGYYIPCQKCIDKYGDPDMMREIIEKSWEKIRDQFIKEQEAQEQSNIPQDV